MTVTGTTRRARSLRRLWPVALCAAAWLATLVIMISAATGPLAVLGFGLWAALPYLVLGGVVLLTAGRSRPAWLAASILAVVVVVVGIYFGVSFLRSDDAQVGLIWVFGPLYQLMAAVVVGLPIMIIALVRHPVAER